MAKAVRRAVLIAGPTASGKSAQAVARARKLRGAVVNADSMQVYSGLRVLTARPGEAEMGGVPHHLYGFVDPARRFSAGEWLRDVEKLIQETGDRSLIFVGGTGLYFEALTKGFTETPEVPAEVEAAIAEMVGGLSDEERQALLEKRDPETAARIRAADPQRVIRALSVLEATGERLSAFQDRTAAGMLDGWDVEKLVVDPGREVLRERIAQRFEAMMEQGAVEEVKALLARCLDPELPSMKAIGVREIGMWLAGEISREEAMERAVTATRQYAKRQRTWIRNRMADWEKV